ncbi:MAG TPA: extracellular solute-binding protein [Bacillota bacterium]|nr:extracellular solute-binding protein [Bacillota bacterium]
MKIKKLVSLVLLGLLVVSLVSTISFAAKKQPVTLTVCLPGFSNSADPALQDETVKYMEQQNNVIIKKIYIPMNSYSDKLSVLLASGEIPDVYQVTKAMVNVQSFATKGYAMDIDKYVKKNKICKTVIPQKYFDYMRVNGKVCAIPRAKEQEKVIWLRRDIADKYGVKLSSTPTTEEFYNEMKKITSGIPFSFPKFLDNLPVFYNAFGTSDEFTKNKKGKYVDTFNSPEMRECLAYVNRLYKDGILDKEFPTTENTTLRQNLVSGKAAANVDYDNRFFYYYTEINRLDPNAKPNLQPIFKLVGPKGAGGTLNEAMQDAFAVSPKCKNPQAAVDLIAWMVGTAEGIKAYRFGLPEKHYTVENGLLKLTPQAASGGMTLDPNGLLKQFVDFDALKLEGQFPNSELNSVYNTMIVKEISKHSGPKYVIPAGASAIYDNVGPSLIKKRQELALKMILGTVSIDDGFKEYEAYFKSINGEQMIKELNTKKK